jgi:hypothetical protein
MTDVTTIKVSKPLRLRIAGDAASEGVSAAAFLERLVDRYEREQRLLAVGRVYRTGVDQDYVAETDAWDAAASDGLDSD